MRYVDSAGWTWDVCEIAREAEDGATRAGRSMAWARFDELGVGAATTTDRELPRARAGAPADRATGDTDGPLRDAATGDAALYFLSRLGTRKLRHYPPGWEELPFDQLEALCRSAEIV